MQIKRLLDDRIVVIGDRLINSQGEHCEFVEHANGQPLADKRLQIIKVYWPIVFRSYT